mmetsp:Transcript_7931/g.23705  ORF Transcript_7931/g.23705 Transcript_7931/m.23705 type:complete len:314 (+) Transcript_7931:219-1160(+)
MMFFMYSISLPLSFRLLLVSSLSFLRSSSFSTLSSCSRISISFWYSSASPSSSAILEMYSPKNASLEAWSLAASMMLLLVMSLRRSSSREKPEEGSDRGRPAGLGASGEAAGGLGAAAAAACDPEGLAVSLYAARVWLSLREAESSESSLSFSCTKSSWVSLYSLYSFSRASCWSLSALRSALASSLSPSSDLQASRSSAAAPSALARASLASSASALAPSSARDASLSLSRASPSLVASSALCTSARSASSLPCLSRSSAYACSSPFLPPTSSSTSVSSEEILSRYWSAISVDTVFFSWSSFCCSSMWALAL